MIDVESCLLDHYPNIVEELNQCNVDVFIGPGRPGLGWDGWTVDHVPLDFALALPVAGEA